jgi:transposase
MPKRTRVVIGGVDTHGRTHHAAVIDQQGRLLGDREFAADSSGYRQLLGWLSRHGQVDSVGVEGTGSYGAGLTRFLLDAGVKVVEVDRPDRRIRRQRGKSDSEDVAGEDVRRGHQDGLTRSPTDHWVSCLGSVGHAGWPRRARTEQAP